MIEHAPDVIAFSRAVGALAPYMDQLVLVGGWAHRLHALHETASGTGFAPLMTHHVDLAAPDSMAVRGVSLASLLGGANFRLEMSGTDASPASRYRATDAGADLYVEFVTRMRAGGLHRSGARDDTVEIAGVTAARLRHVEILLVEPWEIRLTQADGFPVEPDGLRIRVTNPASFMAQKLLVLPRRPREKQGKDVLYVYDTLTLFSGSLPALADCWRRVTPLLHRNQIREVVRERDSLFGSVTDVVRRAAVIASAGGRPEPPPAERIAAGCRRGLAVVFGT